MVSARRSMLDQAFYIMENVTCTNTAAFIAEFVAAH